MRKAERVTEEVRRLADLDLSGLRSVWRRHGYGEPPRMRSTELLARLLAWKIQAEAFGGLDGVTLRLLKGERVQPPHPRLLPGMLLSRDWQGEAHQVEVAPNGFLYRGGTYRSLSEVARTITGTRWNGLRFFGLRQAA